MHEDGNQFAPARGPLMGFSAFTGDGEPKRCFVNGGIDYKPDNGSYDKSEPHPGIRQLRMGPEGRQCRPIDNRIQNRPRQYEDNRHVQRHAFVHQAADQRNHPAFTYGEEDAEQAAEQDGRERLPRNPAGDHLIRHEYTEQ
ncbi:hypothetical protein D3C81_1877840 [compost metagenome]